MKLLEADSIPRTGWRLGTKAGLAVYAILAAAIGSTAMGALWIAENSLRRQAEQNGRRTAGSAAEELRGLEASSAANTARTLDIVMEDQLRAIAATSAMLVEAAEAAGHGAPYIEDTLRQITARSPIRRIDVSTDEGPSYATETPALRVDDLPPPFRSLARTRPESRTATTPARTTLAGLTKSAASQTLHRQLVVRVEETLDLRNAEAAYADGPDSRAGRELATGHTEGIALITAHAIELAEDAGWSGLQMRDRLNAIVRNTSIIRIRALGGTGGTVYDAVDANLTEATEGPTTRELAETVEELTASNQTASTTLPGRFDRDRRWIAVAATLRTRVRLSALVELATPAGGQAGLSNSAWAVHR